MHEYLRQCIKELAHIWEKDPCTLAFALNGSGGRGNDDMWSDADVVLVVSDESYSSVCQEMPLLMQRICGKIHLWLPEGEQERCVNYAFLFEKSCEQFLFDHAVFCESLISESQHFEAGVIFFDRSGSLTRANQRFVERKPVFDESSLLKLMDTYLIYTYINGKYFRRKDAAKMLYIQNTLRDMHIRLLQVFYPEHIFSGWWCGDFTILAHEHQQTILLYASAQDYEQIGGLVRRQLDCFGKDARNACKLYGISYPEEKEQYILRQFKDARLPEWE